MCVDSVLLFVSINFFRVVFVLICSANIFFVTMLSISAFFSLNHFSDKDLLKDKMLESFRFGLLVD